MSQDSVVISCCEEAAEKRLITAQHAQALLKIIKVIIKHLTNVCYKKGSLVFIEIQTYTRLLKGLKMQNGL